MRLPQKRARASSFAKSNLCNVRKSAYDYGIILTLFDGEIMSLDESEGNFMATSSITANFAIRDEKEAKAFISAFLSDSRSTVPPARKRNWKLVDSVKEIEEDCHA